MNFLLILTVVVFAGVLQVVVGCLLMAWYIHFGTAKYQLWILPYRNDPSKRAMVLSYSGLIAWFLPRQLRYLPKVCICTSFDSGFELMWKYLEMVVVAHNKARTKYDISCIEDKDIHVEVKRL